MSSCLRFAAGAAIGLAVVSVAGCVWMLGIIDWDIHASW